MSVPIPQDALVPALRAALEPTIDATTAAQNGDRSGTKRSSMPAFACNSSRSPTGLTAKGCTSIRATNWKRIIATARC